MPIHERIILNKTNSSSKRYTLIRDGKGMGGAGQDKGHYLNNWCVVNGVDRGNGYQGYLSVDYALEVEWVPESAKALIRKTLNLK